MYFVRQISSGARTLLSRGLTPFRNMQNRVGQMRSDNAGTNMRHQMRAYQGKLNYYRSWPKRYLGISFGSDENESAAPDEKKQDPMDYDPSKEYELGNRPTNVQERMRVKRSKKSAAQQVQHLQIHLRDPLIPSHEIIHVGRLTGHLEAAYTLNGVKMQFSQVIEKDVPSDTNIMLRTRSPEVLVNGQPVIKQAIVPNNSVINARGRRYHVDLQPDYGYIDRPAYISASWATHVGYVRSVNEDAIGVYESDEMHFYVVADGVGGGYNGSQISEFAVKYMLSAVNMNYGRRVDWSGVLEDAMTNANIEVRNFIKKQRRRLEGDIRAGTTLTSIHIKGWLATIAHVGDSRLYLLRDESLTQLTTNHNEYLPADDPSTPDVLEIEGVLSRAIGKADTISPEILRLHLEPNDRILICSDGINKQIPDNDLADYLRQKTLTQLPEELIHEANKRLTDDNSTVIVVDVRREPMQETPRNQTQQERVFVSTQKRAIRYERLQNIKSKQVKGGDGDEDETSGGIALGCTSLLILLIALVIVSRWGGGYCQSIPECFGFGQNNAAVTEDANAQVIVDDTAEPTLTPEAEETVQLNVPLNQPTSTSAFNVITPDATDTPVRILPTRSDTSIQDVTATAQAINEAATQLSQPIATSTPNPNAINLEIVSPTPMPDSQSNADPTSTTRSTRSP